MRNRQVVSTLVAESDSLIRPLSRRGVALSLRDQTTVKEVYLQWICLLCDLGYLPPLSIKRDSTRLLTDMFSKDVYDLLQAHAESIQSVRLNNFKGFKGLCRRTSNHFFHLLKEDIGCALSGDVYASKRLLQVFSFMQRLSLQDIDLTQQCLDDYLRVEDEISSDYPDVIVDQLNEILIGWLKSFDPIKIDPRHSSGSVAERTKSLSIKYDNLMTDQLISYVYRDYTPSHTQQQSRVSQAIFVPKSYKTFRTISMEPSALQYLQQGVWREIDRIVRANSFLRNHIDFHSQERNRKLALKASVDGNYATIDLSSASDSVGYQLVKRLFRRTKLLPYIMATRSREIVLPDGRLITLKKFAPSGSALCFPVETLIFAAICQLVTRDCGVPGDYSVFGDDIIVPTQCVRDVANVLAQLGFTMNVTKSYYARDCKFRESCGIEAISGIDVTPMRLSRKYKSDSRDVDFTRLVDLANKALDYEFGLLRQFYLNKLFSICPNVLFGDSYLRGFEMTNYHLPHRWNHSHQCISVYCVRTKAKILDVGDESYRLRHWFETANRRPANARLPHLDCADTSSFVGKVATVVEGVWVNKPYIHSDQDVYTHYRNLRTLMGAMIALLQWRGCTNP